MKNKAILFISDIHYTSRENRTQFCKGDANDYYQKWENYLKKQEKINNMKFKYLVITGDIVDAAKKVDYQEISTILNTLCTNLSIEKENVLLLPGNHDINWAKIENYCDNNNIPEKEAATLFDVKLENFIEFYKEFMGISEFDASKAILNNIFIEELNVRILGLNSLVKESHLDKDHIGYIDIEKLKKEIPEFLENEQINVYVATHHSFTHTNDRELATLGNATVVKDMLGLLGINTFIYGHHHTSESKLELEGDDGEVHRYIEIGSLGKILSNENGQSYSNRFSVAKCESGGMRLYDYIYASSDWAEINSDKYVHILPVCSKKTEAECGDSDDLPIAETITSKLEKTSKEEDVVICDKTKFMIEYLKEGSNYREGHFHWKNGKKTLGWINIAAFLGNMEILSSIKECIIEMYEHNFEDSQVALGYGMEGNIIGSSLLDFWIKNDVCYHSYPSVHKCNEHIKAEKSLWNEYGDFQNVLLICDIMPTKAYLDEIIESNDMLKKCTKFYVLSLFCNKNLLNSDGEERLRNLMDIRRYALAEVNIPICELAEEECIIYKEELKKIYTL